MTLVIGIDEAGYGPNLGPLVIGASVWHVDTAPAAAATAVTAAARACPWADSKRVYRAGAGLAALETAALAGVRIAAGVCPQGWGSLAAILECDAGAGPEHGRFMELALPVEASATACEERAAAAAAVLAGSETRLVAVRCRLVQPDAFNRLLLSGLNKSDILSWLTLDLAAALRRRAADEPAAILCDRHGGRMRYGPLLARHFDEPIVRPLTETATCSAYELPASDCRAEFRVGGESLVPVALASMLAKYVRELAMRAFNGFWSDRVPGLRGTAGYPVDAARWRAEAAAGVEAAGVAWDAVWRRA